MSNPDPAMTIGAVAALAGKRPSSIRYYEQIGLLPPAARVSGRRVYGADTVRTLAVIETGQRAGLALDEIKALLSASPDDQAAIDRLREVATRKLPQIEALIERTEIVRGWLASAARCECPSLDQCPLFDDPALLPGRLGYSGELFGEALGHHHGRDVGECRGAAARLGCGQLGAQAPDAPNYPQKGAQQPITARPFWVP